ncbi:hypothetical protein DFQ26_001399, partial [Actinomortierella ambigua]
LKMNDNTTNTNPDVDREVDEDMRDDSSDSSSSSEASSSTCRGKWSVTSSNSPPKDASGGASDAVPEAGGVARLRAKAVELKETVQSLPAGADLQQKIADKQQEFEGRLLPLQLKRDMMLPILKDAGISNVFDVSSAVVVRKHERRSVGRITHRVEVEGDWLRAPGCRGYGHRLGACSRPGHQDHRIGPDPVEASQGFSVLLCGYDPNWGSDMQLKIVDGVRTFFEHFEKHYSNTLAEVFPFLAYRYMDASLMECRTQTHYAQRIRLPEYEPKNWEAVKRCVFDLLNLGSMRADIGGILANVSRGPQEEVDLFVERCRTMYRTIEGDSLTTFVCRALNNGLPQRGREQVLAHFGSLEKIPSVEKLLEFLSTHKSVFDGERVKSTSWYYQRFKESPFRVMTSTQQIGFISSSKALSTTSPPTTTMRAKPSSPSQLFTKRNNSSMATIRTPGASRLAQQTGATCNRPSCVSENAKQSVDKCWSVTDPARFAQREARYQASLAQQRGTGGQSMVTKRQSANVSSVSSSRPTKKRRATQSGSDKGRKRTAAASAIEVAALSTQHSEEVLSQAEDEVSETLSRLSLPDSIPDHYMDHQGPVSLLDTPEEMEPLMRWRLR